MTGSTTAGSNSSGDSSYLAADVLAEVVVCHPRILAAAQPSGSSSRRETPAQLQRSTTAVRAADLSASRSPGDNARSSLSRRSRSPVSPVVKEASRRRAAG